MAMTSNALFETVPPNAPSYEEAMNMNGPSQQLYPNVIPEPYYPQTVQPSSTPQLLVHNFTIGGLTATCTSCQKPLHTRAGYVSTCSTHCAFLFCCLFLCWPCAPFVYCTKMCREPRLFCSSCGARI